MTSPHRTFPRCGKQNKKDRMTTTAISSRARQRIEVWRQEVSARTSDAAPSGLGPRPQRRSSAVSKLLGFGRKRGEGFDKTAMYDPRPLFSGKRSGRDGSFPDGDEERGVNEVDCSDGESVAVGDMSGSESKSGATRGERGLMARRERLERAARLLRE